MSRRACGGIAEFLDPDGIYDTLAYSDPRLVVVPAGFLRAVDYLVALGLRQLLAAEHDDAIRDALAERASDNLTVH